MFNEKKCSFRFIGHIIILITTFLQIKKASSLCIEDSQYYSDVEQVCLSCTKCVSPNIVITPCSDFSNTQCGLPKFSKTLDLVGISQEKLPKRKDLLQNHKKRKSKHNRSKKLKEKKYKKGRKFKNFKKFKRKPNENREMDVSKLSALLLDKTENSTLLNNGEGAIQQGEENKNILLDEKQNKNILLKENSILLNNDENLTKIQQEREKKNISFQEEVLEPVVSEKEEKNLPTTNADVKKGLSILNVGKYVVLSAIGTVNILLLLVALGKLISYICCKKKAKDGQNAFIYNQKLPDPSLTPVKCRFTAVLPTKSAPQYANVDSYLNPIVSSSSCEASDETPTNSNNSCSTAPLNSSLSQETTRSDGNINFGVSNVEREAGVREPLINTNPSNNEVIESANTIQLYSRIPSPNPFTMDRLLESRRAVGYPSVENNLYVETWCSSPSPVLPRSQSSSVAPSPASYLRKPFSTYSNSSSPVTTRTFRATPAFSSFQPLRS